MKMFKWSLRVFSVVSVIILFAFAGGYVFAAFNIGTFNTTFNQALSTEVPNAPTGVTFTSADVQVASLTSPVSTGKCTSTDSSTATTPGALATASTIFVCVNSVASTGYLATDSIQTITITWGTTAPVSTTYELSIYMAGATSSTVKAYVETPSTLSAAASAMITFDLTSGLVTSVSSISVLVSQCSGTTCP